MPLHVFRWENQTASRHYCTLVEGSGCDPFPIMSTDVQVPAQRCTVIDLPCRAMWMVQVFISLDPWIPACACRLQHIVQREFPVAAACLQGSVPFAIAVVLRCHSFCSDIFLSPPTLLEEVMFRLFDWRARVIFMRQRSAICRQIFTFFVDPQ